MYDFLLETAAAFLHISGWLLAAGLAYSAATMRQPGRPRWHRLLLTPFAVFFFRAMTDQAHHLPRELGIALAYAALTAFFAAPRTQKSD